MPAGTVSHGRDHRLSLSRAQRSRSRSPSPSLSLALRQGATVRGRGQAWQLRQPGGAGGVLDQRRVDGTALPGQLQRARTLSLTLNRSSPTPNPCPNPNTNPNPCPNPNPYPDPNPNPNPHPHPHPHPNPEPEPDPSPSLGQVSCSAVDVDGVLSAQRAEFRTILSPLIDLPGATTRRQERCWLPGWSGQNHYKQMLPTQCAAPRTLPWQRRRVPRARRRASTEDQVTCPVDVSRQTPRVGRTRRLTLPPHTLHTVKVQHVLASPRVRLRLGVRVRMSYIATPTPTPTPNLPLTLTRYG